MKFPNNKSHVKLELVKGEKYEISGMSLINTGVYLGFVRLQNGREVLLFDIEETDWSSVKYIGAVANIYTNEYGISVSLYPQYYGNKIEDLVKCRWLDKIKIY